MEYYLHINEPDIGAMGLCIGGKFFGYLSDEEFRSCRSVQFLAQIDPEDIELLNIGWSCYSFVLTKCDALKFLKLYAADVRRIKGKEFSKGILSARELIYLHNECQDEDIKFIMGESMTNSEYLIKLLEEEDGAITDYLTCKTCVYRNKTCDAFKKTCDRGRSRWLKKEREEEKMEEKLKPCPFCCGKVSITYNSAENVFRVWHSGSTVCEIQEPIEISGEFAKSLEDAANVWNRRAGQ